MIMKNKEKFECAWQVHPSNIILFLYIYRHLKTHHRKPSTFLPALGDLLHCQLSEWYHLHRVKCTVQHPQSIFTPIFSDCNIFVKSAIKRLNNTGDMMQSWWTPILSWNTSAADRKQFTFTLQKISVYKFWSIVVNFLLLVLFILCLLVFPTTYDVVQNHMLFKVF